MSLKRHLAFAICVLLLLSARAPAQLQDGDLIVPGQRIIDGFGSTRGCFYVLRNGNESRHFETGTYNDPNDMIIDSQGRLVFFAKGPSGYVWLMRIDPATGVAEPLYPFPDNLDPAYPAPEGTQDLLGWRSDPWHQSLHLYRTLDILIDDDVEGGRPQIDSEEAYGFSMRGRWADPLRPHESYLYRSETDVCEVGTDVSLMYPTDIGLSMAAGGGVVYYTNGAHIGSTTRTLDLQIHLDGSWGTLSFTLVFGGQTTSIVDIDNQVFDNTLVPNSSADCGFATDDEVPCSGPGFCGFSIFSGITAMGLLGDQLYLASNSCCGPYIFGLQPRQPFLNPHTCDYWGAVEGAAPVGFGEPVYTQWNSADGGVIIGVYPGGGQGTGVVKEIGQDGSFTDIQLTDALDEVYSGRPAYWYEPGSPKQLAKRSAPDAKVLVLRADALVHFTLTDGLGRQIGYDAEGLPVNDFGEAGQLIAAEPEGWPKLVLLQDPLVGEATVDVHATGAGDWELKAYLAHESLGGGIASSSGTATEAGSEQRILHVENPSNLAWLDPTDVGEGGATRVNFAVGPVPSKGPVDLSFRAPDAGALVRLDVYDLRGRRVATPLPESRLSGPQQMSWNWRDEQGRAVARGVYVLRLSVEGHSHLREVVYLR